MGAWEALPPVPGAPGEHLPGVVGMGVEAAGVNMRCRHAADLAPRPFWYPCISGRLEETRGRLAAQTRPARRV